MFRERTVVEAEWKLIDDNLKRHGIDQIQGTACILDGHTVEVSRFGEDVRRITGEFILIATGSHPQPPDGIDVDGQVVVDSDTLLTVETIPQQMIVIGGGVIGCEYACTFAALGVKVTIINSRSRLLAHLDPEISDALRQQMTSRLGIQVVLDANVSSIRRDEKRGVVRIGDETELSADCILFSAGRLGCVKGLGLETAGVEVNNRNYVVVDDKYRTSVPSIFAAGDVIGFPALASTSMEQARVAVCHAFGFTYKRQVSHLLPFGIYTIPEVSCVGLSEEQAREKAIDYVVGRAFYRDNARGKIVGDRDGVIKLVFEKSTRKLIGCHCIGDRASELVHVGQVSITLGGTCETFI